MPRVQSKYNPIYSNGHMVWLDTNLQQLFIANTLLQMGFYLERWQEIEDFEDEVKMLKEYIRKNLWDEKQDFFMISMPMVHCVLPKELGHIGLYIQMF